MLGQELADIRVAAADPLADELVEVADHLTIRRQVLGRHRADGVAHALHELVEDLLAEPLDELVEPLARVGIQEVVLAQVTDPRRRGPSGRASSWIEPARAARSRDLRRCRRPARPRAERSSRRSTPARSVVDDLVELRRMSPRTSPKSYRSRRSWRRRARRSISSWRPGMSGRVGSPLRQPRSMRRRSASARSPSAMTSSARASRISSASRSGRLRAVPARVAWRAAARGRVAGVVRGHRRPYSATSAGRGRPAGPGASGPRRTALELSPPNNRRPLTGGRSAAPDRSLLSRRPGAGPRAGTRPPRRRRPARRRPSRRTAEPRDRVVEPGHLAPSARTRAMASRSPVSTMKPSSNASTTGSSSSASTRRLNVVSALVMSRSTTRSSGASSPTDSSSILPTVEATMAPRS